MNLKKEKSKLFNLRLDQEIEFYTVGDTFRYYAAWKDNNPEPIYLTYEMSKDFELKTGCLVSLRIFANIYLPDKKQMKILDAPYDYVFPLLDKSYVHINIKEKEKNLRLMKSFLRLRVEKNRGKIKKNVDIVDENLDIDIKRKLVLGMVDLEEFFDLLVDETRPEFEDCIKQHEI